MTHDNHHAEGSRELEAKLDRLCESVKHWAQNGMTAELLEIVEWNRKNFSAPGAGSGEPAEPIPALTWGKFPMRLLEPGRTMVKIWHQEFVFSDEEIAELAQKLAFADDAARPAPAAGLPVAEQAPTGVGPSLEVINQFLRKRLIARIDENSALLAKISELEGQEAPATGLVWTREKPLADGWYWVKFSNEPWTVSYTLWSMLSPERVKHYHSALFQWAGPIPEPPESTQKEGDSA